MRPSQLLLGLFCSCILLSYSQGFPTSESLASSGNNEEYHEGINERFKRFYCPHATNPYFAAVNRAYKNRAPYVYHKPATCHAHETRCSGRGMRVPTQICPTKMTDNQLVQLYLDFARQHVDKTPHHRHFHQATCTQSGELVRNFLEYLRQNCRLEPTTDSFQGNIVDGETVRRFSNFARQHLGMALTNTNLNNGAVANSNSDTEEQFSDFIRQLLGLTITGPVFPHVGCTNVNQVTNPNAQTNLDDGNIPANNLRLIDGETVVEFSTATDLSSNPTLPQIINTGSNLGNIRLPNNIPANNLRMSDGETVVEFSTATDLSSNPTLPQIINTGSNLGNIRLPNNIPANNLRMSDGETVVEFSTATDLSSNPTLPQIIITGSNLGNIRLPNNIPANNLRMSDGETVVEFSTATDLSSNPTLPQIIITGSNLGNIRLPNNIPANNLRMSDGETVVEFSTATDLSSNPTLPQIINTGSNLGNIRLPNNIPANNLRISDGETVVEFSTATDLSSNPTLPQIINSGGNLGNIRLPNNIPANNLRMSDGETVVEFSTANDLRLDPALPQIINTGSNIRNIGLQNGVPANNLRMSDGETVVDFSTANDLRLDPALPQITNSGSNIRNIGLQNRVPANNLRMSDGETVVEFSTANNMRLDPALPQIVNTGSNLRNIGLQNEIPANNLRMSDGETVVEFSTANDLRLDPALPQIINTSINVESIGLQNKMPANNLRTSDGDTVVEFSTANDPRLDPALPQIINTGSNLRNIGLQNEIPTNNLRMGGGETVVEFSTANDMRLDPALPQIINTGSNLRNIGLQNEIPANNLRMSDGETVLGFSTANDLRLDPALPQIINTGSNLRNIGLQNEIPTNNLRMGGGETVVEFSTGNDMRLDPALPQIINTGSNLRNIGLQNEIPANNLRMSDGETVVGFNTANDLRLDPALPQIINTGSNLRNIGLQNEIPANNLRKSDGETIVSFDNNPQSPFNYNQGTGLNNYLSQTTGIQLDPVLQQISNSRSILENRAFTNQGQNSVGNVDIPAKKLEMTDGKTVVTFNNNLQSATNYNQGTSLNNHLSTATGILSDPVLQQIGSTKSNSESHTLTNQGQTGFGIGNILFDQMDNPVYTPNDNIAIQEENAFVASYRNDAYSPITQGSSMQTPNDQNTKTTGSPTVTAFETTFGHQISPTLNIHQISATPLTTNQQAGFNPPLALATGIKLDPVLQQISNSRSILENRAFTNQGQNNVGNVDILANNLEMTEGKTVVTFNNNLQSATNYNQGTSLNNHISTATGILSDPVLQQIGSTKSNSESHTLTNQGQTSFGIGNILFDQMDNPIYTPNDNIAIQEENAFVASYRNDAYSPITQGSSMQTANDQNTKTTGSPTVTAFETTFGHQISPTLNIHQISATPLTTNQQAGFNPPLALATGIKLDPVLQQISNSRSILENRAFTNQGQNNVGNVDILANNLEMTDGKTVVAFNNNLQSATNYNQGTSLNNHISTATGILSDPVLQQIGSTKSNSESHTLTNQGQTGFGIGNILFDQMDNPVYTPNDNIAIQEENAFVASYRNDAYSPITQGSSMQTANDQNTKTTGSPTVTAFESTFGHQISPTLNIHRISATPLTTNQQAGFNPPLASATGIQLDPVLQQISNSRSILENRAFTNQGQNSVGNVDIPAKEFETTEGKTVVTFNNNLRSATNYNHGTSLNNHLSTATGILSDPVLQQIGSTKSNSESHTLTNQGQTSFGIGNNLFDQMENPVYTPNDNIAIQEENAFVASYRNDAYSPITQGSSMQTPNDQNTKTTGSPTVTAFETTFGHQISPTLNIHRISATSLTTNQQAGFNPPLASATGIQLDPVLQQISNSRSILDNRAFTNQGQNSVGNVDILAKEFETTDGKTVVTFNNNLRSAMNYNHGTSLNNHLSTATGILSDPVLQQISSTKSNSESHTLTNQGQTSFGIGNNLFDQMDNPVYTPNDNIAIQEENAFKPSYKNDAYSSITQGSSLQTPNDQNTKTAGSQTVTALNSNFGHQISPTLNIHQISATPLATNQHAGFNPPLALATGIHLDPVLQQISNSRNIESEPQLLKSVEKPQNVDLESFRGQTTIGQRDPTDPNLLGNEKSIRMPNGVILMESQLQSILESFPMPSEVTLTVPHLFSGPLLKYGHVMNNFPTSLTENEGFVLLPPSDLLVPYRLYKYIASLYAPDSLLFKSHNEIVLPTGQYIKAITVAKIVASTREPEQIMIILNDGTVIPFEIYKSYICKLSPKDRAGLRVMIPGLSAPLAFEVYKEVLEIYVNDIDENTPRETMVTLLNSKTQISYGAFLSVVNNYKSLKGANVMLPDGHVTSITEFERLSVSLSEEVLKECLVYLPNSSYRLPFLIVKEIANVYVEGGLNWHNLSSDENVNRIPQQHGDYPDQRQVEVLNDVRTRNSNLNLYKIFTCPCRHDKSYACPEDEK